MAQFEVRDIDRGYKKFLKRSRTKDMPVILSGILRPQGMQDNAVSNERVAVYAHLHEFGQGGIVEKAFMRNAFDKSLPEIQEKFEKMLVSYVEGDPIVKNLKEIGDLYAEKASKEVNLIGLVLTGLLQSSFRSRIITGAR